MDVLSALCDESLPLTKSDHEEFGNPLEDKKVYESICSYSPYENLSNQVKKLYLLNFYININHKYCILINQNFCILIHQNYFKLINQNYLYY